MHVCSVSENFLKKKEKHSHLWSMIWFVISFIITKWIRFIQLSIFFCQMLLYKCNSIYEFFSYFSPWHACVLVLDLHVRYIHFLFVWKLFKMIFRLSKNFFFSLFTHHYFHEWINSKEWRKNENFKRIWLMLEYCSFYAHGINIPDDFFFQTKNKYHVPKWNFCFNKFSYFFFFFALRYFYYRNALSLAMLQELNHHFELMEKQCISPTTTSESTSKTNEEQRLLRALVISSNCEKIFSSGHDLKELVCHSFFCQSIYLFSLCLFRISIPILSCCWFLVVFSYYMLLLLFIDLFPRKKRPSLLYSKKCTVVASCCCCC